MLSRTALLSLLGLMTIGSAALVTACSSSDEPADDTSGPSDDEIKKTALGAEGASCSSVKKCKTGLLCKKGSSGPPPGAMGLPVKPGSSSGGPPPGAMGLPMNPDSGNCAKPGDGEEGGRCNVHVPCLPGLVCEYPSSGPPPGAVGLPLPSGSASTHGSGPPPGTMGLPIIKNGTCEPKSSGPPPGTMGLPLPPHS